MISRFSIKRRIAHTSGTTELGGNAQFVYQFFIDGRTLIAPNNYFAKGKAAMCLFLDIPREITKGSFSSEGAAVSLSTIQTRRPYGAR